MTYGKVLIYNEFGSSLHPLLTSFLLSLFFDESVNTKHAQIVFNTQEIYLLNEMLLRRDEIYLAEKIKKQDPRKSPALKIALSVKWEILRMVILWEETLPLRS